MITKDKIFRAVLLVGLCLYLCIKLFVPKDETVRKTLCLIVLSLLGLYTIVTGYRKKQTGDKVLGLILLVVSVVDYLWV